MKVVGESIAIEEGHPLSGSEVRCSSVTKQNKQNLYDSLQEASLFSSSNKLSLHRDD
jgi:hypothetical protein